LALDDTAIWSAVHEVSRCKEPDLAELAGRILERRLYKSVDITAMAEGRGGDATVAGFRVRLSEARNAGELRPLDIFEDSATRDPYKLRGYDTPEALAKVLIRRPDGTSHQDLAERSEVVRALRKKTIFRIYAKNEEARNKVREIAKGVGL
jgi:hypothetical protein